uniref:Uncharacterized protein n=1 Tax=Chromera velia CCMP2878 TaxID=1169474 RepID=A0A0G4FG92_9ALVE|eukprot:Cvel_16819.t1-p1 / transcript=Cvel_16819.t1 / gene=Cvel_16819 / organism=Chromera_velia_CCMP2878 / gene_product=hypothetical protein / transcript_product=hypothetical protein / location=Cvel_scaffold1313:32520-33410(-) / protein_length=297 / sequence_SO=supercontig / SO=protein_coding / is_pseudo=false
MASLAGEVNTDDDPVLAPMVRLPLRQVLFNFLDCSTLRCLAASCKSLHKKKLFADRGCFRVEDDTDCQTCSIFRCSHCPLPDHLRCRNKHPDNCTEIVLDGEYSELLSSPYSDPLCNGWCKDKEKCAACGRLQYKCVGSCAQQEVQNLTDDTKWPEEPANECLDCFEGPFCKRHRLECEECGGTVCKSCARDSDRDNLKETLQGRVLCSDCRGQMEECCGCGNPVSDADMAWNCDMCGYSCEDCMRACGACGEEMCPGCAESTDRHGEICMNCQDAREALGDDFELDSDLDSEGSFD